MAEKSDIPRASASLRSITPMVRITGGPVVDSAPMRAWTYIMLVPPGKEEHRAASYGSRCDHAVPRPEPMLTQESTDVCPCSHGGRVDPRSAGDPHHRRDGPQGRAGTRNVRFLGHAHPRVVSLPDLSDRRSDSGAGELRI